MKNIITNQAMLRVLKPELIRTYLLSNSWSLIDENKDICSFWHKKLDNQDVGITVPENETFVDYPARVSDVLRILQRSEGVDQYYIYKNIRHSLSDIIRTASGKGRAMGTISCHDLDTLVNKSYSMFKAAASSTDTPRPVVPANQTQRVKEYLNSLLFAQSEYGSYVLPIISPIRSISISGSDLNAGHDEKNKPFARKTTETLAKSLDALLEGINDERTFNKADMIRRGVSANLCEAIADLLEDTPVNGYASIGFTWSGKYQAPEVDSSYRISSTKTGLIREFAEDFRNEPEESIFREYGGHITNLHKEEGKSGEIIRRITLKTKIEDSFKKIYINLDNESYDMAISYHKNTKYVFFRGVLRKEGNRSHLDDAQLLPDDPPSDDPVLPV